MTKEPTKPKPRKPADRAASPRYKRKKGEPRATPQMPTLRKLTREYPSEDEARNMYSEISIAQDRTVAPMLASQVERYLEWVIISRFPRQDENTTDKLVGRDGPLSSFYGNIWLAYAMGLIDEEVQSDLNTIRNIRNAFAHAARPITFATPGIDTECGRLRCKTSTDLERSMLDIRGLGLANIDGNRVRYVAVCLKMIQAILQTHPNYNATVS